jgi:hypothetical protein
MADEDAVDILGLDPGIGERRADDLQHQRLDIFALVLAEGRVGPADDAACHDMSPSSSVAASVSPKRIGAPMGEPRS